MGMHVYADGNNNYYCWDFAQWLVNASSAAIERLEAQIDDAMTDVAESAIFGICDMQKNIIKRLRMTATGVDDVTNATTSC